MASRRGRPQRPYQPSWGGDPIPGLYRKPDGRWRIIATGKEYTEPDERQAIARFRAITGGAAVTVVPLVRVPEQDADEPLAEVDKAYIKAMRTASEGMDRFGAAPMPGKPVDESGQLHELGGVGVPVPEEAMWAWCAERIIADPQFAAKMLGIPEIANLRHMALPRATMTIPEVLDNYRNLNPSYKAGNTRSAKAFEAMTKAVEAKTLDDLTQAALAPWRDGIENSPTIKSAQTKKWLYGAIKAVLGFNLKCPGVDAAQIRAALDRCKILWTADAMPPVKPNPIDRAHFHTLLEAGNGVWRAWLLVALNCCLHMDEVCNLRWTDLDLEKGHYRCVRQKTRRQRVPRAATLWPETIEAIKALPKKGSEYVFVSMLGTKFSRNGRINDFCDLRKRAGLPDEATFDSIRDGAYTIACHDTTDERLARVLAGHRAAGLQDNYVLRNPQIVRPACEAVYKAYGPFPMPPAK